MRKNRSIKTSVLRLSLFFIWTTAVCWGQSGTPQQIYSYTVAPGGYAPNGNLTNYTDTVTGSWNMEYDNLNRLTGASVTPPSQAQSFMCWHYDSFGNRLTQAASQSAFGGTPNADCRTRATGALPVNNWVKYDASNHATSSSQSTAPNSLLPDAAGNMTTDGQRSFLYDAEGRLCAVSADGVMTGYLYNAEGQRVAKGLLSSFSCDTASNGFTVSNEYILGQSGEQVTEMAVSNGTSTWAHSDVYANGQLLATYDQQGLHFNLSDALGTKRVQVSGAGNVETSWSSLPYGDGLISTGTGEDATEHHFTGKERDSESGLDYFGARYYGSSMGRFMSPDYSDGADAVPFGDLDDPQSLNLYSYVGNNPLSNTDPDGHDKCKDGTEADVCVTADPPDPPSTINWNYVGQIAQRATDALNTAAQTVSNYLTAPRNPGCMNMYAGAGAVAGAGVGGYVGAGVGGGAGFTVGLAGGGVMSIPGGAGGTMLGGTAGAGVGGFLGGAGGGAIGYFACASGGGTGAGGSGGGGGGLSPKAKSKLGNLANRAGEKVRDVIRSRGGSGANVQRVGQWADRTLGEAAEAAARGDSSAETAIKVAKQAGRLGQQY